MILGMGFVVVLEYFRLALVLRPVSRPLSEGLSLI